MIRFDGQELTGANFEQPCVLMGEPQKYKTTILLHYAYLKARQLENDQIGMVICSQSKLDFEDRLLFGRGDYRKNLVTACTERIKLKYIETYSDLCKFLVAFSLLKQQSSNNPNNNQIPRFLFIDDLNYYAGADPKKLCYLLLLLRNVASFMSNCNSSNNKNLIAVKDEGISSALSAAVAPTNNNVTQLKGFNVVVTWQIEEGSDVTSGQLKQQCLVFRNYLQNLFQLTADADDSNTLQMFKIHQDLETLAMLRSPFRSNEFKEILQHIQKL